jgi:hypothetical protein
MQGILYNYKNYFIFSNKMTDSNESLDIRLLASLLINIGIGLSIFFLEKQVSTNNKTLMLNILFCFGILLGGFITLFLNNGGMLYKILLCIYTLAGILGTYFSLKNYDDTDIITQKIRNGTIVFAVISMSIMIPMLINRFAVKI